MKSHKQITILKECYIMSNLCPQCGAPAEANAAKCVYCGASIITQQTVQPQVQTQAQPQVIVVQQAPADPHPERKNWPVKSKIAAALLAFFLGGIGVHKFYLGKVGSGILYLLFCWTGIPSIFALIDGIVYLCTSDENFMIKYKCRLQ